MSRPDKVRAEFRGVVKSDTAIAGVFGPTGLEDLVLVKADSGGELVLATQATAEGLIVTTEGKADSGVANFLTAAAGAVVTVYTHVEIVDDSGVAGDELWSTAAGDVVTTVPAAGIVQPVARTILNDPAKGGTRTIYNIKPTSFDTGV